MGNPVSATSSDSKVAGVKGECTKGGGFGLWGVCDGGHGVHGESKTSRGVVGTSEGFHGVFGKSLDNVGVAAESQNAEAINALSHSADHAAIVSINDANGVGVQGRSGGNVGVVGESDTGRGVMGISNGNLGVSGESQLFPGVRGHSVNGRGTEGFSDTLEGVVGISKQSTGVLGISEADGDGVVGRGRRGVVGESDTFQGVFGHSRANAGVVGESEEFDGVFGTSKKATAAGVSGHNAAGGLAGFFDGDVEVTGDIRLTQNGNIFLPGADFAESFDVTDSVRANPGTVMVINEAGGLETSHRPYDKKVAGVISGAGKYKPGIILDQQTTTTNRMPIALLGKTYCKVDAQNGSIEMGDMLTTSGTPGHAMRAEDPSKAFGAIIGKALQSISAGRGLIPILIALQ